MSEDKSIREELEAAMSDDSEEVTDEQNEATEVLESESQGQARDEKGRFTKSEETTEDGQSSEISSVSAHSDEAVPVPSDTEEVPPTEKPPTAAPNGWSSEAKAAWGALPDEVQQQVLKREQDVHKRISRHDETRNFGESMQRVVSPYFAQIKAEGGTPETAVQELLNTAYLLRTGTPEQKRVLLLQTAQQFGVDLSDTEIPQVSPEVAALRNELNQLRGQITTREQNEMQSLQAEVERDIEAFASDPANVHYEEVKAHMAALLSQGAATDMKDAYDQACWAQPEIRATLIAQRMADEEQKRKDDAKAKAEEARRKSVSLDGGTSGQPAGSAPEDMTLRQQLEAGIAAQSGAV